MTNSTTTGAWPARLFGIAMMLLGAVGWWYNGHLVRTEGEFSIKLCVFVPLALAGGLLMAMRPDWAGPWRSDSSPAQKMAVIGVLVVMAGGSGAEFLRLKNEVARQAPKQNVIAWTPEMGRPPALRVPSSMFRPEAAPSSAPAAAPAAPAIPFLGRQYQLGSYNQRNHPMWEFVTGGETVNNWTTLLTIIDRPDARTREDLDRLAEGILNTYRSRGAKILLARTMGNSPETAYNYAVAVFEEPQSQRCELNFVKMQIAASGNAAIVVHGVRIADPRDSRPKLRAYLDSHSSEIGKALERMTLPDLKALPRREF